MPKRKAVKTKPVKAKVFKSAPKLPMRYIRVWNKQRDDGSCWVASNASSEPPDACADALIYELPPP